VPRLSVNKASRNKPVFACILLVCYGLILWVSVFHTHECLHDGDHGDTQPAAAFQVNIPAQVAPLVRAYWLHSDGSAELSSGHHCCVDSDLRDCDQDQFFSRNRRGIEGNGSGDLFVRLVACSEPESNTGLGIASEKLLVSAPSTPLTSIRSVRLVI
jgi:hypothetical protein